MLAAQWIIDREVDQVNLIYADILGGMAVLYGLQEYSWLMNFSNPKLPTGLPPSS